MMGLLRREARANEENSGFFREVEAAANDFSDLGLDLCDVKGQILAADDSVGSLSTSFDKMMRTANETLKLTRQVREASSNMEGTLSGSRDANGIADNAFASASARINELIETVTTISQQTEGLKSALDEVSVATRVITDIAGKTSMLSINAAVEAARAGEAGKGFAIVAGQVQTLAEQTAVAANKISKSLDMLNVSSQALIADCAQAGGTAVGVRTNTDDLGESLETLTSAFESLASAAQQTGEAVNEIDVACSGLVESVGDNHVLMRGVSKQLNSVADGVTQVNTRADGLVARMASSGAQLVDTKFIELAKSTAVKLSSLFEAEVDAGRITMEALFDYSYQAIPGTDPVQYMTPFTEMHERVVQSIIDGIRDSEPQVVFCSATDPNGYLAVNNSVWSKPQGDDPVWNAANSRNRRLLDDPVSRASGRGTGPFRLQTYRRDMGGGRFDPMKDVSAPITVKGRHWGGFRIAFNPRSNQQ